MWLTSGVEVHTRYSGIGVAEMACHHYQSSLERLAAKLGQPASWAGFSMESSWDLNETVRHILPDYRADHRTQHLFGDMMQLAPQEALDIMSGLDIAAGPGRAQFWHGCKQFTIQAERNLMKYKQSVWCYCHEKM